MRKRKTKKTKTGSRLLISAALAVTVFGLFAAWLPENVSVVAAGEKSKKPPAYSVVAGTVFRESGLSLPGATVTLAPEPIEGVKRKGKPLTFVSDQRGEFAFRVPPAAAKYVVSATMKGRSSETKTVSVGAEERIDVTFTLREESKQ